MDCVFCKIISEEFDSAKIYEDDNVFAFLDIKPVTKGHVLIIPKRHAQDIFDIPKTDLQSIIAAAKKISQKIKDVLGADGIRLSQSNGEHAGQVVFHYHLHVIPRYKDDGITMNETAVIRASQADIVELKQLAEKLKI